MRETFASTLSTANIVLFSPKPYLFWFKKDNKMYHDTTFRSSTLASFMDYSYFCAVKKPISTFRYTLKTTMMRTALLALLLLCATRALAQSSNEIFLADPTIVSADGNYYLTGTEDTGRLNGFPIYCSRDLKSWTLLPPILTAGAQSWGTRGFWAPQLVHHNGRWLLFYTANEQVVMAASPAITGPFTQDSVRPIDASEKNIDPFLFIDDDGRAYLYHVRFDHGNYIWCGQFDLEHGRLIPGTLRRCFAATQPWEHTRAFPSDPILEGPTVIKREGKYYLFYSANHFLSPDYAVGYAVADSPMGPWTKNPDNPILHSSQLGEHGSGHGDIFLGPHRRFYYVYHVHHSDSTAVPRRTRIIALDAKRGKDGTFSFSADNRRRIVPHIGK